MKRLIMFTLAIMYGVVCADCFAKKPKNNHREMSQIDSIRHEMELRQKARETDSAFLAEMQKELERERILDSIQKQRMREPEPLPIIDYEKFVTPCQEEAQSTEEYFAALGISENEIMAQEAIMKATRNAQLELLILMGKDELAVEKMEQVCRKVFRDSFGTWNAYVALRYPKKNYNTEQAETPSK